MNAMDELGSVLALTALVLGTFVATDALLLAPDADIAAAERVCPGYGTANLIAVARQECVTTYRTSAGAGG